MKKGLRQVQSNVILKLLQDSNAHGWLLWGKRLLLGIWLLEPSLCLHMRSQMKPNHENAAQCFSHLPFCCVGFHFVVTVKHCLWLGFSALALAGQRRTHPLLIVLLIRDPLMSVYLKNCIHSCGKYGSYSTFMEGGYSDTSCNLEGKCSSFSGLGYKQYCLCCFHSSSPLFVQALTQVGLFCI